MKSFINFIKGFKLTKKTARMVLLLFFVNLVFAMILAVPMYHSLKDSFGDSLLGESMAEGFDMLWWEEYRDQSEGLDKTFTPSIIGKGAILNNLEGLILMTFFTLPPAVLIFGLIYIIFRTFLAGGILSTFNTNGSKFSLKKFFGGAGSYFSHFFLVMLLSWFVFFGVLGFLYRGLGSIRNSVAQNSFSEITPFYLGLFFSVILLFLLLLLQMLFDYTRIQIVVEQKKNILFALRDAFRFIFKHFGSTLGLFYLLFLVNFGATLIYLLLKSYIPQSTALGVISVFFIQQLFVFALIFVRCWLYASELELYKYWR
jgi:hypothetical protein